MSEASNVTVSREPGAPRALRILAKSTFRELKSCGYNRSEILAFATEMLALVSSDLRDEQSVDAAAEE